VLVNTTEIPGQLGLKPIAVTTWGEGARPKWLRPWPLLAARSTVRRLARLLARAGNPSSIAWSLCQRSYLWSAVDVRSKLGAESPSIGTDKEPMADEVQSEDAIGWLTRRFAWEQELDRLGRQALAKSSPQALSAGSPLSALISSWVRRPEGSEPVCEPARQCGRAASRSNSARRATTSR
jgi:hypothetical protein